MILASISNAVCMVAQELYVELSVICLKPSLYVPVCVQGHITLVRKFSTLLRLVF